MKYIFAGLYFAIKSRRPDGTPYFNMRLFFGSCVNLTIFNLLLFLEKFNWHFIPSDKASFMLSAIVLYVLVMAIIGKYVSEDQLREIAMEQREIKRINFFCFAYFFLNLFLMAYLMAR
jgi:hypothetical protein